MFESLLKYTAYADQKIIQVFERNQNCGDRAVLLFSHVLNAQHVWIKRILKEEEMYGVWEIHIPQKFQSIHLNNIQLLTKMGQYSLRS